MLTISNDEDETEPEICSSKTIWKKIKEDGAAGRLPVQRYF